MNETDGPGSGTTNYFAPRDYLQGELLELPPEEAHHAARVVRQRRGDVVTVVDGAGGWFRVRLDEVDRHAVRGTVLEERRMVGEPAYRLTMGLGLLKNRNRFETAIEKLVELGVSRIVPLRTERVERPEFRRARVERILTAAMKQCGRSVLPRLEDPASFSAFLAEESTPGSRFICHEALCFEGGAFEIPADACVSEEIVVLVGPEGGFAPGEVERAVAAGYRPVGLGPRRLRAETAAIAAAAGIMLACARMAGAARESGPDDAFHPIK